MSQENKKIMVEGTVCVVPHEYAPRRPQPVVFIITDSGQSFGVDPSFVGRYMELLDGVRVRADGDVLLGNEQGGLLRINGLTIKRNARPTTQAETGTQELATHAGPLADPTNENLTKEPIT